MTLIGTRGLGPSAEASFIFHELPKLLSAAKDPRSSRCTGDRLEAARA
jgi:hypothetical protein